MNLPAKKIRIYPSITALQVGKETLTATMSDGRAIAIPLAWFPVLANASRAQLNKFEISPSGYGIHWPELDEDISVKAFFD